MNSKRVGNSNERNLAKLLSKWTGWEFHRTPASGGLHWCGDYRVVGDVICDSKHVDEFPFSVETKRRRGRRKKSDNSKVDVVNISDILLRGNESFIMKCFCQASEDASRGGLKPILFLRNVGMSKYQYFVFMDLHVGKRLRKTVGISGVCFPEFGIFATTASNLFAANCHEVFSVVLNCL